MKTVYLLRHAKASTGDASMGDSDRPLSAQGRESCEIIGKWLKEQLVKPGVVLCSSSVRTRQTWELVSAAAGIETKVEFNKKLYLAAAGEMIRQLQALDDAYDSALIVGHNPGIHECVIRLCAHGAPRAAKKIELKYPTGSLAVIECEIERWSAIKPECGFLTEFVTPKNVDD